MFVKLNRKSLFKLIKNHKNKIDHVEMELSKDSTMRESSCKIKRFETVEELINGLKD